MVGVTLNQAPNVSTQAVNQQIQANTAARPAPQAALQNVPPAIANDPAAYAALGTLRQRYPGVADTLLTGGGMPCLTRAAMDQHHALFESVQTQLTPGTAAIVLGSIDDPNFRVAVMPTAGVPGPDPNAAIQKYVLDGETLYRDIINNNAPQQPSKEEVSKVMWFLQALASSKALESSSGVGGPALFASGAMTIEDPGGKLATFFESANSYPRSSSHLRELQNAPGCRPFGVDVRGVPTPNERRTVLLQRLPEEATDGKKMLFLKMEEHGCRGLSFKGTGLGAQAERELSGWDKFSRGVKRFFSNVGDFIGHAGGFFRSLAQQAGLAALPDQDNRERVDDKITRPFTAARSVIDHLITEFDAKLAPGQLTPAQFEQVKSAVKNDLEALKQQLDSLDVNKSAGGVHRMLEGLDRAVATLKSIQLNVENSGAAVQGFTTELMTTPMTLLNAIRKQIVNTSGDHLEMRFGREVILTADEMAVAETSDIGGVFEGGQVQRTLNLPQSEQNVWREGVEFTANFPNAHSGGASAFDGDVPRNTYVIRDLGLGGYTLYDSTTGQRDVTRANTALGHLTGPGNNKIRTAIKNLAHQGSWQPMATLLTRDFIRRYDTPLSGGNMPSVTEIIKQPADPLRPGVDVYEINYDTEPCNLQQFQFPPGVLQDNLNLRESTIAYKLRFNLVHDTLTDEITVQVVTPPTVDVTLTGKDHV